MKDDLKKTSAELGRISAEQYALVAKSGIAVVLDNVRSAHNVGSAFRTADAFRADCICLCGICDTPPSAAIHKAALGAELSVPWRHYDSALVAIETLRGEGYVIVSVEQTSRSIDLADFTPDPGGKYALVFGNEVEGVSQEVVDASDFSIEIAQYGTKHSLNVSVTAGIVLYSFSRNISFDK